MPFAILFIWILTSVIMMTLSLLHLRTGSFLYLLAAVILPSLWIGNISLRFELLFCPWLIILMFFAKREQKFVIKWHNIQNNYLIFLSIIIIATSFSLIKLDDQQSSLVQIMISLYGIIRPLIVMIIFMNISIDDRFGKSILNMFVYSSIFIILLSYGQSTGFEFAERLTISGYTSQSRDPIFALLEDFGVILRSTGVFESPVYNAVYYLFLLAAIGIFIARRRGYFSQSILYILLGAALIAGLTTLTSTFLLGLAGLSILFIGLLLTRSGNLRRSMLIGACILSLFVAIMLPQLAGNNDFVNSLKYQINRITTFRFMESRYDTNTGFLLDAIEHIRHNMLMGSGFVKVEGVFIGDSIYIVILYLGGIIGLGVFLWMVFSILRITWRNRRLPSAQGEINQVVFWWTIILLVTGIGSPSFFILRLQEWYWALVGITLNPNFGLSQETRDETKLIGLKPIT